MAKASRGSSTEKYNSVFATRLRRLFDERPNITQAQLSKTIGVTRQTISQYLNGISEPSYAALVKIADYFDVSLDYLLGRSEARTTDLNIKNVCEITGLNEHSIDLLNGINACAMDDKFGEIQLFGRNPDYALCLVNEFIDFAFSPIDEFSIPYDHYLSFREQVEQNQIASQKWEQLTTEEQNKLISETLHGYNSANSVGLSPFFPEEAAILFRNIFCDSFSNYLASKHPTKKDPLNNNRLGGAKWQRLKNTPAKMG